MKEVEQEDIIVQFQLDGKSLHSSITKAVIHLRSSIPTLIIELFARMANELSIYRTQSLGSAFAKVSRSPSYMTILVKSPEIGYRTIAPEMFLQSLLFNWNSVVTQKSLDFMMYSEFDTFHKFNFSEKISSFITREVGSCTTSLFQHDNDYVQINLKIFAIFHYC